MARNRYVRDYRLLESFDEKGKVTLATEYIGGQYLMASPPAEVRKAKRQLLIMCAAGWVALLAALVPVSTAARSLWAVLPLVFSAIPLWMLSGIALDRHDPAKPMRRKQAERLENRFPAAAMFLMILPGAALIGEGLNLVLGRALLTGDIWFSAGAAVLLAIGAAAFRMKGLFRCRGTGAGGGEPKETAGPVSPEMPGNAEGPEPAESPE